jgi:hypothetical protein
MTTYVFIKILTYYLFAYNITLMTTFLCIRILSLAINRFFEKKKFNVYEEGCKNPI